MNCRTIRHCFSLYSFSFVYCLSTTLVFYSTPSSESIKEKKRLQYQDIDYLYTPTPLVNWTKHIQVPTICNFVHCLPTAKHLCIEKITPSRRRALKLHSRLTSNDKNVKYVFSHFLLFFSVDVCVVELNWIISYALNPQ